MIEDFIIELEKPCRAVRLLLIFLHDYISDNIVSYIEETSNDDRLENTLAIIHAINLVCDDIKNSKKNIITKWLKKNIHKNIFALKLFSTLFV